MKILDIRDYGAIGDGKFNNTKIIQECIDICTESGGTVYVGGKGTYLCGTFYLKSNVTIDIEAGSTLLASSDIRDYGKDTHHNRYRNEKDMDRCWIYACDAENIKIEGEGVLDGNAQCFPNEGDIYRPMMFRFLRCRNIHISGVSMLDAAAWTTAFLDSENIWVEDVTIRNEKRYNGDGLDFDGCSHVYVRGCSITGTDDNLCLQAGSKKYVTEDVHISDCTFTSLCAGIRIGLKSVGIIRNVVINNCIMKNIWREGIKVECSEGGEISGISVQNIVMENVSRPIYLLLNNRFEPEGLGSSLELEKMPEIGTMENLVFSHIIAKDTQEMEKVHYRFQDDIMGAPWFNGIRVDAEENHKIRNLTLDNIYYCTAGGVKQSDIPDTYPKVLDRKKYPEGQISENYYPDWSRAAFMDIRHVENLFLGNIQLENRKPDERPPYIIENCSIRKKEIHEMKR